MKVFVVKQNGELWIYLGIGLGDHLMYGPSNYPERWESYFYVRDKFVKKHLECIGYL